MKQTGSAVPVEGDSLYVCSVSLCFGEMSALSLLTALYSPSPCTQASVSFERSLYVIPLCVHTYETL